MQEVIHRDYGPILGGFSFSEWSLATAGTVTAIVEGCEPMISTLLEESCSSSTPALDQRS